MEHLIDKMLPNSKSLNCTPKDEESLVKRVSWSWRVQSGK